MNLSDVFKQAKESSSSASLSDSHSECYIDNGVKICKDRSTGEILIFNTMRGGDYYELLNHKELEMFADLGWGVASVMLALQDASKKRSHAKAMIENDDGKRPEYTKMLNHKLNQIQEKWNRINTKLSLISA